MGTSSLQRDVAPLASDLCPAGVFPETLCLERFSILSTINDLTVHSSFGRADKTWKMAHSSHFCVS